MADRYTGRHIHHPRHVARANWKRSRFSVLPAAAALTISGILIGGTGAVTEFGAPGHANRVDVAVNYDDPSALISDARPVQADRTNRYESRVPAVSAVAPPPPAVLSSGTCKASYYSSGTRTANGEHFEPMALTAASKTLPFNSLVRVTNPANGKTVTVRINDRGPYVSGRCFDLSKGAFAEIANLGVGVVNVQYEVLARDA